MKKLAIIRIIPLLAAVALLAGCSSLTKVTREDPENPNAPPYVYATRDRKNEIDIERLYRQGLRKVIVKNVRLTHRKEIGSSEIKGTLVVTDELNNAYPNLIEQIESNRKYNLWLQLEKESSVKGDKKSRVVVAYVKDIEGLRSVEEIEAERAREAAEKEAREEARKERIALAERIIAKKYGSLFSGYSDYKAWWQTQIYNGDQFMKSLLLNQEKTYSENDRFIVKKHKLEIKDMQFTAGGGFAYLVGSIGHVAGYSRPCYLISETQIPYTTAQAMITKDLLLEYIGEGQYREGYQVKTCDVFLAFVEGTAEYANYQSMIDDLKRIERNPSEYAYILDE